MKIQNSGELAVSDARKVLLSIAEAGLQAIDTAVVMRETMRMEGDTLVLGNEKIDLLRATEQLIFIAIGKCAAEAQGVVEAILGDRISGGVVVDVKVCPVSARLQTFCGTHPLPSDENLHAAEAIVKTLAGLNERDLVIFAVSGGGSTLLFLPEDKSNREETKILEALMRAGAKIREVNIVRKHLSLARGGYLAKYAYPARVVSILFNDVPSADVSFIASGPTVKDITTIKDAAAILAKYNVQRVCDVESCGLIETPKDDKYFERVTNLVAVSNVRALDAMKRAAEAAGFRAEIRSTELSGEATDVARTIVEALHAAPPKTVLLWGGETTVTVHGTGEGGRNMELSLSVLDAIKDDEILLSLASDGRDHGPFAGVICDTITKKAIVDAGLDAETFIKNNDEYGLVRKVGHYLMTGDTGSNVSDLVIAIKM